MSDFPPGEYRTRNGTAATVICQRTYFVGAHKSQFLDGMIDGNAVGWHLDGTHSYGNYVLPGHADFDLVHP